MSIQPDAILICRPLVLVGAADILKKGAKSEELLNRLPPKGLL